MDEICFCLGSVLSNFAEGFERDGNAEFMQFLTICKGSVGELRAQLIYCLDIELIQPDRYEALDLMAETAPGFSVVLLGI